MDIEHYFTETGNGEPLILLHGNFFPFLICIYIGSLIDASGSVFS